MAITKQAKNINITVANKYQLIVGGTLSKVCDKVNFEAQFENLTLSSNKKVNMEGNKQQ